VNGPLTFADTLVIQGGVSGGPGGLAAIASHGNVTNTGTIDIGGGAGASPKYAPGDGGTLSNAGSFTNDGLVALSGGAPGLFSTHNNSYGLGGYGALLENSGTLANAGSLTLGAGAYGPGLAQGAALTNSGVLLNSGVLDAAGSPSGGYYPKLVPVSIRNAGTFSNTGMSSSGAAAPASPVIPAAATARRWPMRACCPTPARCC
jgi:hypothetical protein